MGGCSYEKDVLEESHRADEVRKKPGRLAWNFNLLD